MTWEFNLALKTLDAVKIVFVEFTFKSYIHRAKYAQHKHVIFHVNFSNNYITEITEITLFFWPWLHFTKLKVIFNWHWPLISIVFVIIPCRSQFWMAVNETEIPLWQYQYIAFNVYKYSNDWSCHDCFRFVENAVTTNLSNNSKKSKYTCYSVLVINSFWW